MKILWFTTTACNSSKLFDSNSFNATWLDALENKLNKQSEVELFISFYHHKKIPAFDFGNTSYFPVHKKEKILSKINKRIFNRFKVDELEKDQLLEIINKIKPDIIHIHGTETNFGLIQKYTSIPVVISIQGILNQICEKFFSGVPSSVVKKFEPKMLILSPFSQIYRFKRYKSMAKNEMDMLFISKHIIGRTSWDRRVTSVLSSKGNYYHVNELLRENFYENIWDNINLSTKQINIVTITGSPIYKGFETIIRTALILRDLKNIEFSWNIIGLSKNDNVVKMIVSWLKVKLNDINIKLYGKLSPEQFIPIMLRSNIYCQASHIENSPNSLCEAMCLGMPIIATFAGGTESMLENNKEGILIQDGDPYSMAGAIMELKNNPENTLKIARNARKRALKRHDPDKIVADLIKTYKEILNEDKL